MTIQLSGRSDDPNGAFRVRVGAADRGYTGLGASVERPEIDEQDLIVAVVDQFVKCGDELDPAALREIAPEDGELQVIAIASQQLVDLRTASIIADVVADKEASRHYRVVNAG